MPSEKQRQDRAQRVLRDKRKYGTKEIREDAARKITGTKKRKKR